MRRRRSLLVGLGIGLSVGLGLALLIHWLGWLGTSAPSWWNEPPAATTAFARTYSLLAAAQGELPAVPWTELWNHTRETYVFDAQGTSRRRGALIRYCVIRNSGNHPIAAKDQSTLHQRLFQGMVASIQAEGAEVFDASPTWASSTETVLRPLPHDPQAKPLPEPNVRPFVGGQICYRSKAVEGRVFSSVSGEGGPAATIAVVIVEQPSDSRFHRLD
jgi:hypothetical protein